MLQTKKIEERGGVLIIFFVALLSIVTVLSTDLEEKVSVARNKQLNYSDWYNTKSTKQILKENQLDYLEALNNTGIVAEDQAHFLTVKIGETRTLVKKYELEKTEILLGSENVPKENRVQELDGEFGIIVGLKEWERLEHSYTQAIGRINLGILAFQISIVFGVICLVIHDNTNLQNIFTGLMIVFGLLGIIMSFYGYSSLL